MNTFGKNLRLTTFGESHGPAVGGVLDGMPPGVSIDLGAVAAEMAARRPGGRGASSRGESDEVEFLSGISVGGLTLGTPIGFIIRNRDMRSSDYDALARVYRPCHADYTYMKRYGIRDHRGGGRASARETASRVAAGALAGQWLAEKGIEVRAALVGVGAVQCENLPRLLAGSADPVATLQEVAANDAFMAEIERARRSGDSVGGMVACVVTGVPPGIGSPVYGKLHAHMAAAMMSINAAKGFDYGLGFQASESMGSAAADCMRISDDGEMTFGSNCSGGVQGGISCGLPIFFRVAFKPTPSIGVPLESVSTAGENVTLSTGGRHDPCVALRAVAVVKAMAALTVADMMLEPGVPHA